MEKEKVYYCVRGLDGRESKIQCNCGIGSSYIKKKKHKAYYGTGYL